MPLEVGCRHFCWREQQQPILFLLYSCRANTVFPSIRLNALAPLLHVTRVRAHFYVQRPTTYPRPLPSSLLLSFLPSFLRLSWPSLPTSILGARSRSSADTQVYASRIPVYLTRTHHHSAPPLPSFTLSPSPARSPPPPAVPPATARFLFLRYSIPRDRLLRVYARYTISPVSRHWRRVALIFKLGALSAVVCQNTGAAYRLYSCPFSLSLFSLPFILSIYSRVYVYMYIYSFDSRSISLPLSLPIKGKWGGKATRGDGKREGRIWTFFEKEYWIYSDVLCYGRIDGVKKSWHYSFLYTGAGGSFLKKKEITFPLLE